MNAGALLRESYADMTNASKSGTCNASVAQLRMTYTYVIWQTEHRGPTQMQLGKGR